MTKPMTGFRANHICAFALLALMGILQSCSAESSSEQPVRFVDVETAVAAVRGGMTVVDVRSDGEWSAGHLQGARHLPLSTLELALPASDLDRGQPVLLHCASGGRAARANRQFTAAGFTDVRVLRPGGYNELSEAGLPTVALDPDR